MLEIKFEIPNKYGRILNTVFENIDLSNKNIHLQYDDAFDKNNNYVFEEDNYTGKNFIKKICNKEYYIIHLNLCLYPFKEKEYSAIKNYNDFVNSSCELILFIVDCEYVQIFIKDRYVYDTLIKNVKNNLFKNIEVVKDSIQLEKDFSILFC